MKTILTILTAEKQAMSRAIRLTDVSAFRARLARVVSIDFDGHASCKGCFVGNRAMQFSECPLRGMVISTSLLPCGVFTAFAFGAFPNVCQMFQSKDALRMRLNDVFGNCMVGLQLEPSLVH